MLGPSGSGKTTTLRMIAGFEMPDEGTIELAGEDVSRLPPYDRPVNTVFQDYALFPHMTVQQNVEYGLMVKKVKKGERRRACAEALEMVRLGGYGDRKPAQLSGGQRQRVALARAIVNQPEGAAARRAARRARPQAAPGDADRAEVDPARGRHHVRLRDARPGGGADDDATASPSSTRAGSSRSARRRRCTSTRRASSSPGSSASRTCIERDGRRYTVRPEKIRLLDGRRGAASRVRTSRRASVRDVLYVGPGDAVPRHARPRWRAAGPRAEPRGGLERGARGEGTARAPRVAPGAGVGDRRIGGRIRMRRKRIGASGRRSRCSSARSRCRGRLRRRRRRERRRARRSRASARRSRRSRRTRRTRARSTSSSGPATRTSRGPTQFTKQTGCKVEHEGRRQLGRHGRPHVDRARTTASPRRATRRCG